MRSTLKLIIITSLFFLSCARETPIQLEVKPTIYPDYSDIKIPVNIAPLNFYVCDSGQMFKLSIIGEGSEQIELKSKTGSFSIPQKKWKRLLALNSDTTIKIEIKVKRNNRWFNFLPFTMKISSDSIMPWVVYRKIDPGNIFWAQMGIYQRNTETFDETPIFKNNLTGYNCVNCHAFAQHNPQKMMLHFRKQFAGTLLINGGEKQFLDTKTKYTLSNATYPAWHPSGRYIAFSVNIIIQKFFARPGKYEVVVDTASDIVLFNTATNCISSCPLLTTRRLENIPAWSPDGRFLYYISGNEYNATDYTKNKYDVLRIAFNPENGQWGKTDTLLQSKDTGKSYSFPSVSPDGRFLLFVEADYGYFTIHNREADLCIMDLSSKEITRLPCNSNSVESYPVWSANGRWIMFVSKRDDNTFSRVWFSHFETPGRVGRPFVLPQKNPHFYDTYLLNFNRPEFVSSKVELTPYEVEEFISKTTPKPVTTSYYKGVDGYSGASSAGK